MQKLKILIACEESQVVCAAFRIKGHEAYSCDVLPCSGGHPEWHLQQDVIDPLMETWDMIIGFPPCTHLATSGARHFREKIADGRQGLAIKFFMELAQNKCPKIALENPVGIMSTVYRKPDQYIEPYQFGDPHKKKTCLWLKGLPPLTPTKIVEPILYAYNSKRSKTGTWNHGHIGTLGRGRGKERSKTYPGIASAMAEQWG